MKRHRRKRLYFILSILVGVTAAVSLAIYALGENMNLYFTPAQIAAGEAPAGRLLRMGGMVKENSFKRLPGSLQVRFVLTDFHADIPVQYTGILPALFREGQGVVVQGVIVQDKLTQGKVFMAEQVLAKHDEKYMPPGIQRIKKNS